MDLEKVKEELTIRGYEVDIADADLTGLLNVEGRWLTLQEATDLLAKEMEAENL